MQIGLSGQGVTEEELCDLAFVRPPPAGILFRKWVKFEKGEVKPC
jgi:hypothetical protein